jgi:hypothetical protein
MEETPLETSPQFAASKRKINKRFIYLAAVIVILLLLLIVYKLGFSKKSDINQNIPLTPAPTEIQIPTDTPTLEVTKTPSLTNTPIPTQTPTPKPTGNPVDKTTGLDRSKLSVTVENGSGEAGVAATGKDFLTGLGYDISSTSNADNFDYTGVTIQVKSASSDYLTLLKSDLGTKYTISSATSDLSDSNSSDAVVIIGK